MERNVMNDNNDNEKKLEEEGIDVVEIYSDDGETAKFELLDTLDVDKVKYMVIAPLNEKEEIEEEIENVYIASVIPTEDGQETLDMIEDEKIIDKVFEEFKKRNKDNFEFL